MHFSEPKTALERVPDAVQSIKRLCDFCFELSKVQRGEEAALDVLRLLEEFESRDAEWCILWELFNDELFVQLFKVSRLGSCFVIFFEAAKDFAIFLYKARETNEFSHQDGWRCERINVVLLGIVATALVPTNSQGIFVSTYIERFSDLQAMLLVADDLEVLQYTLEILKILLDGEFTFNEMVPALFYSEFLAMLVDSYLPNGEVTIGSEQHDNILRAALACLARVVYVHLAAGEELLLSRIDMLFQAMEGAVVFCGTANAFDIAIEEELLSFLQVIGKIPVFTQRIAQLTLFSKNFKTELRPFFLFFLRITCVYVTNENVHTLENSLVRHEKFFNERFSRDPQEPL